MSIAKTTGICQHCAKSFAGNKGKKFCDVRCRTYFHNNRKRLELLGYRRQKAMELRKQDEIALDKQRELYHRSHRALPFGRQKESEQGKDFKEILSLLAQYSPFFAILAEMK